MSPTQGPTQDAPNAAGRPSGLYADPSEGLRAVRDDFNYWTGRLTDTSFQLSLAIFAANWAVFRSGNEILKNYGALTSIGLVLLSLAVYLIGARRMSELHRRRMEYAERDPKRWEGEYAATLGKSDPWPFTGEIEQSGKRLREARTWFPIAAAIALVIAVFTR